jgi:alginate O-acetyltransferase complex protein AlgI
MAQRVLVYGVGLLVIWLLTRVLRSIRARQILFLLVSWVFYASWSFWFLGILLGSSFLNFALGSYLRRRPTAGRLWLGVAFNVLLLSFFKYLPPLAESTASPSGLLGFISPLILPFGMSFWTFQALSYLFDLYREEELNPSLLEFCLYMSFWPTVLSGPICRLPDMLPQFRQESRVSWHDVALGVKRLGLGVMMVGLSQLLGGGLRAGEGINAGFDQTARSPSGIDVWCLAIGYGFLLFFDFAGYSHLAIGTARLFGIRLQENFDRPYLSTTPSLFWTRWHMTLSFWIRDYLFLPLATLRREQWWRNLSVIISMVVFGLWHKGSWLLILWGAYHGVLLVLHRSWQRLQRRWELTWPAYLATPFSWGITFAAMCFGWILFRAHSVHQAFTMMTAVLSPGSYHELAFTRNFYMLVCLVVVGYFAVQGITWLLDSRARSPKPVVASAGLTISSLPRRGLDFLVQDRWVWVTPLVMTVTLYVFAILLLQRTAAARFLYMLF